MSPHMSVIIPNWNGRQLLTECLAALRAQTFRDFEIIVVDNGSTDGSNEWVDVIDSLGIEGGPIPIG
jgi:glycosyltransferase involved in cell wall biosynthesis